MIHLPLHERIAKLHNIALPYLNDSEKLQLCFALGELPKGQNLMSEDYKSLLFWEKVSSIKEAGGTIYINFVSGRNININKSDPRVQMILFSIFAKEIENTYHFSLDCRKFIGRDLFGEDTI